MSIPQDNGDTLFTNISDVDGDTFALHSINGGLVSNFPHSFVTSDGVSLIANIDGTGEYDPSNSTYPVQAGEVFETSFDYRVIDARGAVSADITQNVVITGQASLGPNAAPTFPGPLSMEFEG